MNLIEIIDKSDIAVIEGENKVGKLTFALYSYSQIEHINNVIILSSIQKKLMLKRIESIKNINNAEINNLLENLELLCLKENWLEIKTSYGFDFIYEDLQNILNNTEYDAVILHRPDLMFNEGEQNLAKIFIEKFIENIHNHSKQAFITIEKEHFLTEFIENYTDISLLMKKNKQNREILINYSLYTTNKHEYFFTFNNNKFELTTNYKEIKQHKQSNMLIISTDTRFKKLHKYLFEHIFTISYATNISEILQQIENKPDVIIYQDLENIPEFNICSLVKKSSPESQIIFIINQTYIRTEDKMDAIQAQCYDIFSRNFNLEEYILTIEKINNNFFYSNKIKLLPPKKIAVNYENYCKSVKLLYDERIFFSIIETKDLKKETVNKLRNHDLIYNDKKENKFYLCLINVTKEIFENSLKEKLQLNDYKFIEAIEWDKKC